MIYIRYPATGTTIAKYPNFASLPISANGGDLAITLDTDELYVYDDSVSQWKMVGGSAYTFNAPLSESGSIVDITQASTSTDGYLSSTDWNTFNNKLNSLTFNGPLSELNDVVSISQASVSTDGYLTSTDWNTFNSKVSTSRSISTSAPLSGGGDLSSNRTLSMSVASASTDGYLTSTNWNTFNNKSNYVDPLTTNGDLLYYNNSTTRLPIGNTDGYVLTTSSGLPSWLPLPASSLSFKVPLSQLGNDVFITVASTSTDGYLTSTDWNTFNNKVSTTRSISTSAPLSGGGNLSADRTLSIGVSSTSTDGYLTSTDWNTFNNKVSATRSISTSAPLTGGGNLSADRTLSMSVSSTSTDGYLTSTDWNTFNNKVSTTRTISTSAPLSGGGDLSANRTLVISVASTSTDGYLTSTDWNTFNNKVSGPASATDNAVARFDLTTGKVIQNSDWTISDTPSQLIGPLGTNSAPSYTFTGDLNTGIYSPTADTVGITTGGTLRFNVDTTEVASTLPIRSQDGTVGAPGFSFTGDTNTGLYRIGTDNIGVSTNGVLRLDVSTSAVTSALPCVITDSTESTSSTTGSVRASGGISAVKNVVSGGQIGADAYAAGNSGSSLTLNWNNGSVQNVTLNNTCTFTFSNPIAGFSYVLILTQDGSGNRTVNWPTIKWRGGSAPTLSTAGNAIDIVSLLYDGTNYYGGASLSFS